MFELFKLLFLIVSMFFYTIDFIIKVFKINWYFYLLLAVFAIAGIVTPFLMIKVLAISICFCVLYLMYSFRKESKKQKPLNVYAPPDDREFEDWLNDFSDFMNLRYSRDHQHIVIEIKYTENFDYKLATQITLEHFEKLNYDFIGQTYLAVSPFKLKNNIYSGGAIALRFQQRIEKEKRKNDLIDEEIDLALKTQAPGGFEARK